MRSSIIVRMTALGAAILGTLVLVVSCQGGEAQASTAPAAKVIKIATQSPLSGGQGALGEQIKLGAQLAVEAAAPRFEALGYKLELAAYDDQANPDTGVANANRIINDPDILAIVGHYNSGVAIPSSEVYARVNLAMVSPANTNPRITDRNMTSVNRICGRDDVQGPAAAEYAVNDLGAKNIFVIHDKTAYGQGMAEEFRKRAVELGASIPDSAFVGTEEKANFAPLILQIQTAKADLIYFGGIYDQVGAFTKQLRDRKINAPIMAGDGLDSADYERLAGSDNAKSTYYTTVAGPVSQFPAAAELLASFQAKFNKPAEGFAIYAYDCTNIVIKALEDLLSVTPDAKPSRDQITAAVRSTKYSGLTGDIEFDTKGDIKVAKYFVVQVAGTGKWADNKVLKAISVPAPQLQ